MPRPYKGPELQLFGPDSRFGAKKKKGFKEFVYYILWREEGARRERSTGERDRGKAEEEFGRWLTARAKVERRTDGPRDPDTVTVAEVLDIYGEEYAPTCVDPARIGHTIDALLPFFGEKMVAEVGGPLCRAYAAQRKRVARKPKPDVTEETKRRRRARTRQQKGKRKLLPIGAGTVRRDLETLRAAINYCVREKYLKSGAPVTLPRKPLGKERWLTRSEAAAHIRAACRDPETRPYLPLFDLVSLYSGQRYKSVLSLQWLPNTIGGHIDLKRGIIDFNPVGRPKTKKRRAVQKIPNRLKRFLEAQRRRTSRWVFEQDIALPGGKLGRGPIGSIKHSFATKARLARLAEVTPHTLKHTCITWMLQRGTSTWEVAGWTDTSEETIRRVYGHHSPDHLEAARTAFDGPAHPPYIPGTQRKSASTSARKQQRSRNA